MHAGETSSQEKCSRFVFNQRHKTCSFKNCLVTLHNPRTSLLLLRDFTFYISMLNIIYYDEAHRLLRFEHFGRGGGFLFCGTTNKKFLKFLKFDFEDLHLRLL